MTDYVAFLRAINVGGHTVTSDRLRDVFDAAGLPGAETFLASGNVIFRSGARSTATLERTLERHLERALGYEVRTFVRSGAEVAAIAAYRPFPPAAMQGAGALNVGLLAEPLTAAQRRAMAALRTPGDDLHTHGRELYWRCTGRMSESPLFRTPLEKRLKITATFRNLRTMTRLAARYGWSAPAS